MKICTECKYCTGGPTRGFTCKKIELETSLVTGFTSYGGCHSARGRSDRCGPEGKWWEKRNSEYG